MIHLLVACATATPADLHVVRADLQRDGPRALPVRATWADGEAPMPIIVMSHGLGGSRDAYDPLVHAWARAGYLVLQPTHPDSLAFKSRTEKLRLARDPKGLVSDPEALAAWDDRVEEVSLVLDRVDKLASAGLDVSRIDRERVGIAGHSFGAHTTMLCGGLRFGGGRVDYTEERADALVMLSPQGPGEGITTASYAGITLPALVVTGSKDTSPRTGQGPEWRRQAFDHLGSAERWLLWLDGAEHDLGGISGFKRADPPLLDQVLAATTAFWDSTLRSDADARTRLDRATATVREPASQPVTGD